MAFRWQANDGSFILVFGSSIPSSTKKYIKFGPPLTKFSGSAHEPNIPEGPEHEQISPLYERAQYRTKVCFLETGLISLLQINI